MELKNAIFKNVQLMDSGMTGEDGQAVPQLVVMVWKQELEGAQNQNIEEMNALAKVINFSYIKAGYWKTLAFLPSYLISKNLKPYLTV